MNTEQIFEFLRSPQKNQLEKGIELAKEHQVHLFLQFLTLATWCYEEGTYDEQYDDLKLSEYEKLRLLNTITKVIVGPNKAAFKSEEAFILNTTIFFDSQEEMDEIVSLINVVLKKEIVEFRQEN